MPLLGVHVAVAVIVVMLLALVLAVLEIVFEERGTAEFDEEGWYG